MKKLLPTLTALLLLLGSNAFAGITVDGTLSESQYITLATKQNSNGGFGTGIDVSKIVYYPDVTNSILYLGIVGKLDVTSSNAIGVWLHVTGTGAPAAAPAGTALGVQSTSNQSYITRSGNNSSSDLNFTADFPVNFEFAFNPGSGSSAVYFNAAKWNGSSIVFNYQGSCDQSGTSATNSNENGTVFAMNTVTFAFNNGGGANEGLEIAIPFAQLGASVTSGNAFSVFAFVVSGDAYFSNVSVPGNMGSSNPGYNVDFSTTSSGPFHSTPDVALPVEMSSYSAAYTAKGITLNWRTQSEVDDAGFNILRKASTEASYSRIAGYKTDSALKGLGTSTSGRSYTYTDAGASAGATYDYKIQEVATSGAVKDFGPIRVQAASAVPSKYALKQNYPNPFNPTTTISYALPSKSRVTLEVYNALGQLVRTLVSSEQSAGEHEAVFNGNGLASGVYFYRLSAGSFVKINKMMMIK